MKFDGILLCSDLDGTLLDSESEVSFENKRALEYFMENGGKFAFATGRIPVTSKRMTEAIMPNFPSIVSNGSGIYDFEKNEMLWEVSLGEKAEEAYEYILSKKPLIGVAAVNFYVQYHCKRNAMSDVYDTLSKAAMPSVQSLSDVPKPWCKFLFMTEPENIEDLRKLALESEYSDEFEFVVSHPFLFEMLPKNVSKGAALTRLRKFGDFNKVVAIGDAENDIEMIQNADLGFAVSNANDKVRAAADYVTVSNDENALCRVIEGLEKGEF